MALTPVPPGEVATVVTTLEMHARPAPRAPPPSRLRLIRWTEPSLPAYRALFRRVGAPWLWYSRLTMTDEQLAAKLRSPTLDLYAVRDADDVKVGMLELEFGEPRLAQLTFFALAPELTGQGHGRWLMAHALRLAWRAGVERVMLNTCTLDHPSALNFYRAQGFIAVARTLETFADPRVLGVLPPDAAPHIPLFAPAASAR